MVPHLFYCYLALFLVFQLLYGAGDGTQHVQGLALPLSYIPKPFLNLSLKNTCFYFIIVIFSQYYFFRKVRGRAKQSMLGRRRAESEE